MSLHAPSVRQRLQTKVDSHSPTSMSIAEEFERAYGEELQLERSRIEKMESRWEADARGGRVTWLQKNAAWSRKQVAPAIRRVILGETQGDVSSKV